MNAGNVKAVRDVTVCDRRRTVGLQEVPKCAGISESSVQRMLTYLLKKSHMNVR